jgi:hypothetical protein
MANDNLETENARLRDELASLRRQQDQPPQGGPNPLVVHRENAAAEAYQTAGSQLQQLEKQHAELMAEGNFEKAAGLQRQIAAVALQQEQARQQYVAVNGLRSIDPVEQKVNIRSRNKIGSARIPATCTILNSSGKSSKAMTRPCGMDIGVDLPGITFASIARLTGCGVMTLS